MRMQVKQRVIAHESVEKWRSAIEKVEQDIEAILQQEKEVRTSPCVNVIFVHY